MVSNTSLANSTFWQNSVAIPTSGDQGSIRMDSDMDTAMFLVLTYLRHIEDGLRTGGKNGAANEIGKHSTKILEAFKVASTEIEEASRVADQSQPTPNDKKDGTEICQAKVPGDYHSSVQQGNTDVGSQRGKHQATTKLAGKFPMFPDVMSHTIQSISADPNSCTPMMAAKLDTNRHPSSRIQTGLSRRDSSATWKSRAAGKCKAGVVHVYGSGKATVNSVHFITSHIHEGPLREVRIEHDFQAKIVFQHLAQALQFMRRVRTTGTSCFGNGYTLKLGEPLEWDEDLCRMNHPIKERRRLTFVRRKMFSGRLSAKKWRRDVAAIVGAENIDFMHVFNSGNAATAVFRSTDTARKALQVFQQRKHAIHNIYQGVEVTFSSDPCEKELILTTQMPE
ncbi:hypothetical protein Egran_01291 [Elaphomyces granulatus]|uniref:RRM domain-containing protein n=1 Tax=Elaphomyces granulatus TaxID=519963 RepID=A0A232M3N5_9EURO|nr:hypothetical protein Egran_01291 [Elaphomyces granulatus]